MIILLLLLVFIYKTFCIEVEGYSDGDSKSLNDITKCLACITDYLKHKFINNTNNTDMDMKKVFIITLLIGCCYLLITRQLLLPSSPLIMNTEKRKIINEWDNFDKEL